MKLTTKILVCVAIVFAMSAVAIGSWVCYQVLATPNTAAALKAVRKIDTAANTGISLERFEVLLADAHEAYEPACPDPQTLTEPCYTMRMSLRYYDWAACDWRTPYGREAVEPDLEMAHNALARMKP